MNLANTHNEARSSADTRPDRRPEPVCPAPVDGSHSADSRCPPVDAGTAEPSPVAVLGYN